MKTTTELERKYSETANKIDMLMNSIRDKLKRHHEMFEANNKNSGYLGNLGHVKQELNNIEDFLKPYRK